MRKNELQNYDRHDTLRPINSDHEEAVYISSGDEYPIRDILIGRTHPFSEYRINLGITKKYYIFECIVEGRGEIYFDGKRFEIKAGDIYIIDKKTVRNYRSDPKCPLDKIWVSFASDYVDSMLLSYGVKAGVYHVDLRRQFEEVVRVATEETSVKNRVFGIANAIHEMITEIAKTSDSGTDKISEIKNAVLSMLYEKGSLDEIAGRFFMSKSNLIRIFKKHTGQTPYKFLLDEKIKISKVLLRSTNMNVKTIADRLCFSDEHYFSFIFKEKTGYSPLKYRSCEID